MSIGLALSGGGMKGIAHIGAIKALEENNIYPTHISGSSVGAIVGAFYASGYSPEEMVDFFKSVPLFNPNRYGFGKPGIINTENFYEDFKKYFPEDNFNALQKKLYITTVDMLNGSLKNFNEGELIRPILASSAFPGICSPVAINGSLYADGGILDNFPIAPLKLNCKLIIGVYASPLDEIKSENLKYAVDVLQRAIRINFSNASSLKFSECDLLIYPSLSKFGMFDKNHIDEIFNIGYETALNGIKELEKSSLLYG
ncbi:patatin-like phospholipase family protein [Lutibacter sp.]|uniref:patatin-like phospholipase family protein n=1 Tax=Lutibacter sp. TaxID=1925666 RepID=UPI003564735B